MTEWKVDYDSYDAREFLALSEVLTENAEQTVLVDSLEEPAFLMSRRSPFDQIEEAVEAGVDYGRRTTRNAAIYCGNNTLNYSIIMRASSDRLAPTVFEEEIAPRLMDAFERFDDDLEVDTVNTAIRKGYEQTPEDVPLGRTVSGNCLHGKKEAVLCQGVVTVEEWGYDQEDNQGNKQDLDYLSLSESERRAVENLPTLSGSREGIANAIVDSFTDRRYSELDTGTYGDEVESLLKERHDSKDWLERQGVENQTGFCMVEKFENREGYY